ncbi:MAG: cation:proton antiporter [Nitrospiraceae bacterium]|nr:cation:proton antiporter [Nitrospiraceae bacterium]
MEFEFLKSLVIIFAASAFVVLLLHRFKVPSIVGFLIAGAIIGPHGIGLIRDSHYVEMLAEIGVILLLFTIGIEFSLARLARIKKAVIGGGIAQVSLTISLSAVIAYIFNKNLNQAIFFGFLVALSSTAIVLKILSEKGEIDSPHGRTMVGILIFQDLCVVLLMLLIPVLSGSGMNLIEIGFKTGKALLILTAVILSARWIVPKILHQVVHTKIRELFMITIILLCLGVAFLTSRFGLSLALGAFLAGLIIAESDYADQATSDILPFADSFIGLFFVSIGMLINLNFISSNYLNVLTAVGIILFIKIITGFSSALIIGSSLRVAINSGLGLAQIGEFSFVLAIAGKSAGLLSDGIYQMFLASSVLTMALTPFILRVSPSVSAWVTASHLVRKISMRKKYQDSESIPGKRQGHVIVIGFGLNGKNLAKVLKEASLPYVVLEMNNDTVREMKKKGEPIYYGDGTSKDILRKLGIEKARVLVIAISDPASTRRIVSISKKENPKIHIVVRTKYLAEVEDLRRLGADEVIPEEFETSIELFARVLNHYKFPYSVIQDMIEQIRSNSYNVLRNIGFSDKLFEKYDWLSELPFDSYRIPENSDMIHKSIGSLQIRRKTGITIIAIRRSDEVFTNPNPEFSFNKNDIIFFTGNKDSINTAMKYFKKMEA